MDPPWREPAITSDTRTVRLCLESQAHRPNYAATADAIRCVPQITPITTDASLGAVLRLQPLPAATADIHKFSIIAEGRHIIILAFGHGRDHTPIAASW